MTLPSNHQHKRSSTSLQDNLREEFDIKIKELESRFESILQQEISLKFTSIEDKFTAIEKR